MEAGENPNSGKSTGGVNKELSFLPRLAAEEDIKICYYGIEQCSYVYEPFEVHMEKLKIFEMRDDDVLLCTTYRSGSHWMFRVLDMLITGKVEYRDFHLDQVHLDLQRLELLDKLPSPRLLHTHLRFDLLPQQIKDKRTKIVHIYRNPKSAAVSSYFYFNNIKNMDMETLDKVVDIMKIKWTSFWDGLTGYMKENPDNPVFNVAYEEAIADLRGTVKRLRTFLGLSISDDLCDEIADACKFHNQKSKEDKVNVDANINAEVFRKGGNSDWKNHLTVAQNEDIDKFLIERKDRCMFAAKYID